MGMTTATTATVANLERCIGALVTVATRAHASPRWQTPREVTGVVVGMTRLLGGTRVLCVLCSGRLEAVPIDAITRLERK